MNPTLLKEGLSTQDNNYFNNQRLQNKNQIDETNILLTNNGFTCNNQRL
ncbi:hypothetical protein SAMN05421820_106420 [Pedobacter steynii]|uniref:Uncharacterized protein n=1 Tax=Pedobacter steynii TaxID=430522 RepID=A0A1G9ZBZ4_9SPHI|nr:hypothetical protein SAMN05421820_106420 [Pedobacter steynii]